MDPGGSELDSSLPQPEKPCLIVEDSQPDSVALEDDPESSYRAVLARRLSSLQPSAPSPVLELISSPTGSRSSQTDSQSESCKRNSQVEPGVSALHEPSQVINTCPTPNRNRCTADDSDMMESGADSTTHSTGPTEEGVSQFGLLQLSQSQDLRGDQVNSQEVHPAVLSGRPPSSRTMSPEIRAIRSPKTRPELGVQEQQDHDLLSSQQDLFDADRNSALVDSTVSEEEQRDPTPTPAHTLRLLHLSGTLVQESLSQSSVDYVAPTPDHSDPTPLIVPSSPTEPDSDGEEPMDMSAPPAGGAGQKEEPIETSKPRPSASTPVSQSSPGFVLERTLSLPSQPELSHDVFVETQSQRMPPRSDQRTPSQCLDSAALCLQLSVNVNNSQSQQPADDSQDTQIDDMAEPLAIDESDSSTPQKEDSREKTSVRSDSQGAVRSQSMVTSQGTMGSQGIVTLPSSSPKPPSSAESLKRHSQLHTRSAAALNEPNTKLSVGSQATPPGHAPCSQRVEETNTANTNSQITESKMNSQTGRSMMAEGAEQSEVSGASAMALVLSQSQLLSPERTGDRKDKDAVIVILDSQKQTNSSQPNRGRESVSTNGHQDNKLPSGRLSQSERAGPEPEGLKDKSLSDSSGEISFHFTLPKEGELIGPVVGATPPLVSGPKQTLRHSTPIEVSSFSEKVGVSADTSADAAMEASEAVSGESGGADSGERESGKLSLRMKLVTPVEEGSSERFSLQKPALSEEEAESAAVHQAANSPSVFSRVTQKHRQQEAEGNAHTATHCTPARGAPFPSQRSSQASCNSLSNSQSEQQEVFAAPQTSTDRGPPGRGESEDRPGPPEAPQTPPPRGARALAGRGEPASPSLKRPSGPAHRRHVRTIQEVRTTVTRIITDVYYEDGKEVDRKVSQEREEPVVDCQVLDSDISPCRTGSSSVTSGDLADISSLSSKASSLQHSSGGMSSSSGFTRTDFILPPSRGGRSSSPRRGHRGHRGQRGQRAGSAFTVDGSQGPQALALATPRGRARRGRPPSRSSPYRGGGVSSTLRLGAHAHMMSSSEDDPYTRMLPPRVPISPSDPSSSRSDSLRSSPEEAGSAGSSFVGLRVVAKWSSNGYFYSGRIIKDAGDAKFRLRFDDGYECEVAGKDILLCDPIPLETEVTALLEDQYFSVGVVKDHKTEGEELWYSVERDGRRQWYSRTSIILSLDQGNKLREQHSLGPYTPTTPLTKASDISLDNLVEGKRRRRGGPGGDTTPQRGSSGSPRTPGPSGKRKLLSSDEDSRTPPKRGRRGGGARAGQRSGVCNTSGSGTDLPGLSSDDVTETHGPLPPNGALFQGFAFMLTASSESDRLTNMNSSEDEDGYVQTGPYNKSYTESQLQAGGGFILPEFNEEQCKAAYQSLLIADQHCRTKKYLLCVASGVPCVSHFWVRDCCKENKLLNYRNYLLPAGAGPDGAIVEWHPRCSPFKSLRVLVVFEQQVDLLTQLISLGGGSSVRHVQTEDTATADVPTGKFDVVLTDSACPALVQKHVTSQDVPLVSVEWLIQSLIRGERLGYHGNPQYRHDYSSS